MRPEDERRSLARTARSGAVEFGSGPPLAGSGLDARVGGGGGGRGARAARRRRRRLTDMRQLLLLWPVCMGKQLAAATSLLPGRLKKPTSWSSSPPMARSCPSRGELRERVDAMVFAEDDGAMAMCGSRP
ncbi:hypothetical protein OsI_19779 [Oryza sativa Indica Group]|uniref:Uncharacterized protein n=1 Tax=Oryza sativa subsp. indica TaxID=39946 RepID=B8AXS3_ORYSI|nr:hypothetical protein OsI_19779 [Oryza sativa Indica Group]